MWRLLGREFLRQNALIQSQTPVIQKPEVVEALATYLNKTIEAGVLDLGGAKLVKSNNGDAFYTVTAKACSCPAATYHPGQLCKHQRKHLGAKPASRPTEAVSIKPTGKWPGGMNGPVDECKGAA
jgi:hypothetical protein